MPKPKPENQTGKSEAKHPRHHGLDLVSGFATYIFASANKYKKYRWKKVEKLRLFMRESKGMTKEQIEAEFQKWRTLRNIPGFIYARWPGEVLAWIEKKGSEKGSNAVNVRWSKNKDK